MVATFGLCRDIPLMKVSVGRDSENSLKIVTVPLKSGLLATMVLFIGLSPHSFHKSMYLYSICLVSISSTIRLHKRNTSIPELRIRGSPWCSVTQYETCLLPRAHAQGVKQSVCTSVVLVIVVGTKIARSRVLGICACCRYNQPKTILLSSTN